SATAAASCAFFFQAEDGIRDFHVTGVQTCALPICRLVVARHAYQVALGFAHELAERFGVEVLLADIDDTPQVLEAIGEGADLLRSEERRVGKEGRSRWARCA